MKPRSSRTKKSALGATSSLRIHQSQVVRVCPPLSHAAILHRQPWKILTHCQGGPGMFFHPLLRCQPRAPNGKSLTSSTSTHLPQKRQTCPRSGGRRSALRAPAPTTGGHHAKHRERSVSFKAAWAYMNVARIDFGVSAQHETQRATTTVGVSIPAPIFFH